MRSMRLLREAWRATLSAKVSSALVVLLAAAMVAAGLGTLGRAAGAEEGVQQTLEQAGSRRLDVVDQNSRGLITPTVATAAGALSSVQTAVGIGQAVQVTNTATKGGDAAAWDVGPELAAIADLTSGRWPQPGEGLISRDAADALGLVDGFGSVTAIDGHTTSIVGTYAARPGFEDMATGVLQAATPDETFFTLAVVFTSAATAADGQGDVIALLGASDPTDLQVTSPKTVAQIQADVMGNLASYNRSSLLLVLAGGGLLVALVATADVLLRRRDLGRRRALGATRADIILLITARTAIASGLGAALAAPAVWGWLATTETTPSVATPAAWAILAVLVAATGALPAAVMASQQDPVRVLRTP